MHEGVHEYISDTNLCDKRETLLVAKITFFSDSCKQT
jgi:hypothetical protein